MAARVEHRLLGEDDYLALEDRAAFKSEYIAGEIFAMAGASERHNRIAGNLFFHLRAATRNHPCRAFMADMKLRVAAHRAYYYPDAMLVCDAADDHPLYKVAPCFIAEVLSPATNSIDRTSHSAIAMTGSPHPPPLCHRAILAGALRAGLARPNPFPTDLSLGERVSKVFAARL